MVTQMDRAAEETIRAVILADRPDDRIVGEEMGDRPPPTRADGAGAVTWWIDPIGGTTSFVYDRPGWNVSIAAELGGGPSPVVADPTTAAPAQPVRGGGAGSATGPTAAPGRSPRSRTPWSPPASPTTRPSPSPGPRRRRAAPRPRHPEDGRRRSRPVLGRRRAGRRLLRGRLSWDIAAGSSSPRAGARAAAIDGGPLRTNSVLAAHPALFDRGDRAARRAGRRLGLSQLQRLLRAAVTRTSGWWTMAAVGAS